MCTFGVLWLLCEAPAAPKPPRHFKTPPKFNEKTPREERKERILRREREKKARNFGRSRGRAVQGKGGPGEGRSRGRTVQGKDGPGEGRSHQPLKPTPTHETPLHETVKQVPTPLRQHTTQHNKTHNTTQQIKLDLAKVDLAKVGLAKVGHDRRKLSREA